MHIRLDTASIEVTIPSILGQDLVTATIELFLERCIGSVHRGELMTISQVEKIAADWPEYVLGPLNPLGFQGGESPYSMFQLD
jgi:hypothetical protein